MAAHETPPPGKRQQEKDAENEKREAERSAKYDVVKNRSGISSKRAELASQIAARKPSAKTHGAASQAHNDAARHHDSAGQWAPQDGDEDHLHHSIAHGDWDYAHEWAANNEPTAVIHPGNVQDYADRQHQVVRAARWKEKYGDNG
jgi:hypothetical protein